MKRNSSVLAERVVSNNEEFSLEKLLQSYEEEDEVGRQFPFPMYTEYQQINGISKDE